MSSQTELTTGQGESARRRPESRSAIKKTRWGSASSNGTLSLNWRLMFAQPEIVDYVVVHELCHFIQPDHSTAYWSLVNKIMPDAQHWRSQLKEIGDSLTW